MVDVRQVTDAALVLESGPEERAALAERFGIVAIAAMRGEVQCVRDGAVVNAHGRLTARITQTCAISGEDIEATIDEVLYLRFVPATPLVATAEDEIEIELELELDAAALDEIAYEGTAFDLGEALAQSLALAIDPFATGPAADATRRAYGLDAPDPAGPFAALAALKAPDGSGKPHKDS